MNEIKYFRNNHENNKRLFIKIDQSMTQTVSEVVDGSIFITYI